MINTEKKIGDLLWLPQGVIIFDFDQNLNSLYYDKINIKPEIGIFLKQKNELYSKILFNSNIKYVLNRQIYFI